MPPGSQLLECCLSTFLVSFAGALVTSTGAARRIRTNHSEPSLRFLMCCNRFPKLLCEFHLHIQVFNHSLRGGGGCLYTAKRFSAVQFLQLYNASLSRCRCDSVVQCSPSSVRVKGDVLCAHFRHCPSACLRLFVCSSSHLLTSVT